MKNLSEDIRRELVVKAKRNAAKWGLQLVESSNVPNCSRFLFLVLFLHQYIKKEQFLFCEPQEETTRGAGFMGYGELTSRLQQLFMGPCTNYLC
jgi:hypothetical protein